MARVVSLALSAPQRLPALEIARFAVVAGCALALIFAERAFPF
ncbi:hypothetical protein [Novosphingobium sp.]|nr:hypothetical protein [Novosphingobium sp.]